MDNYQGYEYFVTCYEVDEDNKEMTIKYADGTENKVGNTNHNILAMEVRLYRQHRTIMEERLPKWKRGVSPYKIGLIPMGSLIGINFAIGSFPTSFISPLFFMGLYSYNIYKNSKPIKRLKLTDYCLENADLVKLIKTESILQPKLSESGKEAFEKDGSFTLNHAHLYTDRDLKELKKALKRSNGFPSK